MKFLVVAGMVTSFIGSSATVRTIHSRNGVDLGGTTVWTANRKPYSE